MTELLSRITTEAGKLLKSERPDFSTGFCRLVDQSLKKKPAISPAKFGHTPQRGKDRFRFRRVGDQSGREQTDGEETTGGMEPAWSTSSPADANPGARRIEILGMIRINHSS